MTRRSALGSPLGISFIAFTVAGCAPAMEEPQIGWDAYAGSMYQGSMYQGSMYQGSSDSGQSFVSFTISGVAVSGGHLDGVRPGQTGTAVLSGGRSVAFRIDGQTTHVPDMFDATTSWNQLTGGTY